MNRSCGFLTDAETVRLGKGRLGVITHLGTETSVTLGFVIRDERLTCRMIFGKSVGLLPCYLKNSRGKTIADT